MEQIIHKRYVARRRARFKGCNGQQVNIPYGSILEAQDGFLLWKGQPLCVDTSQNAHEFFSQDDDGQGRERGQLDEHIRADCHFHLHIPPKINLGGRYPVLPLAYCRLTTVPTRAAMCQRSSTGAS